MRRKGQLYKTTIMQRTLDSVLGASVNAVVHFLKEVNVLVSYIKVADKMAYGNSNDPDQTAPEGLHCLPFHF